MKHLAFLLLCFCLIGIGGCSRAAPMTQTELDALLPTLVQGTKDNLAGIKSGKGTVTVHTVDTKYKDGIPSVWESSGTYLVAFVGNKFKITGAYTVLRSDSTDPSIMNGAGVVVPATVVCDGEKLIMVDLFKSLIGNRTGLAQMFASSVTNGAFIFGSNTGDAHGVTSLDHCLPNETITGMKATAEEMVGESNCIVVEQTKNKCETTTFWVDPAKGFCISKWKNGVPSNHTEVNTTLHEYSPGLWGPSKHIVFGERLDAAGKMLGQLLIETTYSPDYKLNVPVAAADLVYKIPADVILTDLDKK